MNSQAERLDYLVRKLAEEYDDIKIPESYIEKRQLLRELMNVRKPMPIDPKWLEIQDAFLSEETMTKGIVTIEDIMSEDQNKNSKDNIFLWKGDITRLKVDAIVNAANSTLLGCFHPNHSCIDNAIHSAAGLGLRQACDGIMAKQGHLEITGGAKMTSGFNLSSRYIIHTVGPIVSGTLTEIHEKELENCYKSCLEVAVAEDCHSLAFCCISTGEFHFPNERAAEIAMKTVKNFLRNNNQIKVVFNVFKEIDYKIYTRLLQQD
ncbi:appr-1-p processing enzyme family domain-containing protein [Candidatus Epulonipiscioides saccharophilum]|nr:appr-1-p processing enzyme family domain-containing protein [Epulopiscium sp. SCG-B10WGA-EpuloB]